MRTKQGRQHLIRWFMIAMGVVGTCGGWPLTAACADGSLCAEVQIEIQQDLTLERQAFEAHKRINNGLTHITLENVQGARLSAAKRLSLTKKGREVMIAIL